jgi:hypothetical protein
MGLQTKQELRRADRTKNHILPHHFWLIKSIQIPCFVAEIPLEPDGKATKKPARGKVTGQLRR